MGDSRVQGRARRLLNTANILPVRMCVCARVCVRAMQERKRDNTSKQYSAEKMQMRWQSLQPATWATLTVAATAYGNLKWGHLDLKQPI